MSTAELPLEPDRHRIGRPPKYLPIFAEHARRLCEKGATDREVADYLGVAESTLYRWRWSYPEFREALKISKEFADDRVEMALYRKATGYKFDAVKIQVCEGVIQKTPYVEHVPPDTTAAIFWLKNRRKDRWRDRTDVSFPEGLKVKIEDPTRPARADSRPPAQLEA